MLNYVVDLFEDNSQTQAVALPSDRPFSIVYSFSFVGGCIGVIPAMIVMPVGGIIGGAWTVAYEIKKIITDAALDSQSRFESQPQPEEDVEIFSHIGDGVVKGAAIGGVCTIGMGLLAGACIGRGMELVYKYARSASFFGEKREHRDSDPAIQLTDIVIPRIIVEEEQATAPLMVVEEPPSEQDYDSDEQNYIMVSP